MKRGAIYGRLCRSDSSCCAYCRQTANQLGWPRAGQGEAPRSRLSPARRGLRGYTKVMLAPTELAFQKNWQRDYNSATRSLSGRISDRDVQEALTKGVAAANEIFAEAWTKPATQLSAIRGRTCCA